MDKSLSAEMIAVRYAYSTIVDELIRAGLISMESFKDAFDREKSRLIANIEDDSTKESAKSVLKDAVSVLEKLYPYPGAPRPKPELRLIKSDD